MAIVHITLLVLTLMVFTPASFKGPTRGRSGGYDWVFPMAGIFDQVGVS